MIDGIDYRMVAAAAAAVVVVVAAEKVLMSDASFTCATPHPRRTTNDHRTMKNGCHGETKSNSIFHIVIKPIPKIERLGRERERESVCVCGVSLM
jgi:hypothetical protein